MVVLRCTHALLHRLGHSGEETTARSTTVLGDWYGDVIRMGRRHTLVFVSERTGLPVLLPIRSADALHTTLPHAVASALAFMEIDDADIATERARMGEIIAARTNSRRVLGTISDVSLSVRVSFLTRRDETLEQTAHRLASSPMTRFDGKCAVDLTREAFGLDPRQLPTRPVPPDRPLS